MPNRAQTAALDQLRATEVVDRVIWPSTSDSPRFLYGRLSHASKRSPEEIVDRFLTRYGAIYGLEQSREYRIILVKHDTARNRHVEVERIFGDIRVYPTRMSFWIDATGTITRVKALWPLVAKPERVMPKVDSLRALRTAAAARRESPMVGFATRPTLEYRIVQERKKRWLVLAWNFVARFTGRGPTTEGFVVSASDAALLHRYPDHDEVADTAPGIGINDADETAATPARTLQVDDPGGGANLTLIDRTRNPNIETRDMGTDTNTASVYPLCEDDDGDGAFNDITNLPRSSSNRPEVDAHYNTGLIHDYYARTVTVNGIELFGRDGWNDDVTQLWTNLVHYDTNSKTSTFSRADRVTYHGDGDGTNLTYKPTLDTCTHEWAHGVQMTEVTGGANPNGGFDGTPGENFVLKEALSDMAAASLSRDSGWQMGSVFEDDAAMAGATHVSTDSRLRGLRSPSDFGQPDHYYAGGDTLGLGYAGVTSDYTRVGILDKAAYLIAMGGMHPSAASDPATYPPIAVYGIGVSKFENIADYALNQLSGPADLFADFRQDMIDAAEALYPGGCESSTVARAFDAVGIFESGSTPPTKPSGPDPMITPWGARLDTPPYWQTPDIYVKDAADNPAAPLKGQANRLFALVTNIGDADAVGVLVTFSFTPYGAGTSNNTTETIGNKTVDVPAGASVEVEVTWDLSNLTDTNGGTWPLPLGDFDHFCVKVDLALADDVDPCNNFAQNNFDNVPDVDGDGDGETHFMVGNPAATPQFVAVHPDGKFSRGWKLSLDLEDAVRTRARALHAVTRTIRPAVPWVGDKRDCVVIPMLGHETVAARLRWTRESRDRYDGPVHGCVIGTVAGERVAGDLHAEMLTLHLRREDFEVEIRGVIRTQKGPVTLVRGLLSAQVDRNTGEFEGRFSGGVQRKQQWRSEKFRVNGRLAATAMLSAVVQAGDDVQGLDLGVPLLGDYTALCEQSRHKPARIAVRQARRARTRRGTKDVSRRSTRRRR
jgi:bacillolysin/thermolysin